MLHAIDFLHQFKDILHITLCEVFLEINPHINYIFHKYNGLCNQFQNKINDIEKITCCIESMHKN